MNQLERCNYTVQHTLMSSFMLVHETVVFSPGAHTLFLYFPPHYSIHYLVLLPLPVSPSTSPCPGPLAPCPSPPYIAAGAHLSLL